MRTEQELLADARLAAAIDELKGLISAQYPTTTYEVAAGDDPDGLYLTATVDVDDPDAVVDLFVDRLLTLQIDEGLPLYVIPIRTPTRRAAIAKPSRQTSVQTLTERRPQPGAAFPHRTSR